MSAPLPQKAVERISARCREHGVQLEARVADRFQRLNPEGLTQGPEATARAFADCWLKHRCHLVFRGAFYVCSRPPKLEPFLRRHGLENQLSVEDGVRLDDPALLARLLALLEREAPLASCRHCLGGSGPWAPHRQLDRDEVASGLERFEPAEPDRP